MCLMVFIWMILEIRFFIVVIGELFYGYCFKLSNIKLKILGWIILLVLSLGYFSYWVILILLVVLSILCVDVVFMIDIIIMVYSILIISCSFSFVKGGICILLFICFVRIYYWFWLVLVMIFILVGVVIRVCIEWGL